MEKEVLARILHEAAREAVNKNLVVRSDVPTKGFIEYDDLTPEAKEGRLIQAEFLLNTLNISHKVTSLDGLGIGRVVHYVLPDSEHRAAIVTGVPGTICTRGLFEDNYESSGEFGVIDLTVFMTALDIQRAKESGNISKGNQLSGVRFSSDCEPGTWHWPEKV